MEHSSAQLRVQLAISYPTLHEWAANYELDISEALEALRHGIYDAYGPRVGLLTPLRARYRSDLHRLLTIAEQFELVDEKDVLAFGFQCPKRMCRYQEALNNLLVATVARGAPQKQVATIERMCRLMARLTEEVTTFYQGLS